MIAGDVVLLNFPFSDLSGAKLRPVLVVAVVDREECVVCQITSQQKRDPRAVELAADAFSDGGLRKTSLFARESCSLPIGACSSGGWDK